MRLIADGVVDRDGVPGLAAKLGYSVRQVQRQVRAELGATPLALARAQRAQTARLLIETTAMPMAEVAFAAGFASVRVFNDTVREVFGLTPTGLRHRVASSMPSMSAASSLILRLPFRLPLCPDNLFGHLVATAVPGVEEWSDGAYRRSVRLPHGHAIVSLRPLPERIECRLELTDLRDLSAAIARCRRLLDLDADPIAVDHLLQNDEALAPLVAKSPGRRVPRTVDAEEFAVRAVLGQQVSTSAARTYAGRVVDAYGTPLTNAVGGVTHLFPDMAMLTSADVTTLGLPRTRAATLQRLIAVLATSEIDLGVGSDWRRARAQLNQIPGIGHWTVETIAMRALGDPDAFVSTDLGVRTAARGLGLPSAPGALTARSDAWRPWRAYATQYLWATNDHPINRLPS